MSVFRIVLFSTMTIVGLACLLRPGAIAERMSIDRNLLRLVRFAGVAFLAYVSMRVVNISLSTPVANPWQYFGAFVTGGACTLLVVLVLLARRRIPK